MCVRRVNLLVCSLPLHRHSYIGFILAFASSIHNKQHSMKPFATCGCRKFQLDPLGDHLNTCTVHLGAKKAHDWMVDQVADFFRTTHKVKTQEVVKSRGQSCGDIELAGYLVNATDPVPLVLDLRIAHFRYRVTRCPSTPFLPPQYPHFRIHQVHPPQHFVPWVSPTLCVIYCHSKVFMVQATRLCNLICGLGNTCGLFRGT